MNRHNSDQIARRSFVIWNSSRKSSRKPTLFSKKAWPIALQIPDKFYLHRAVAVRWYTGTFPIPRSNAPPQTHLRCQLRAFMRKEPQFIQKQDYRFQPASITRITTTRIEKLFSPSLGVFNAGCNRVRLYRTIWAFFFKRKKRKRLKYHHQLGTFSR